MKIRKLYIPPSLIAYSVVLMILFYFFLPQFNFMVFPFNLSGLIISIVAFLSLGKTRDLFTKNETTFRIETSSTLMQGGPFSFSRNPMYLFMSTIILGFAILSTNVLSLILPFLFAVLVSLIFIPKEEKLLKESFGEEFLSYKKKVRRWI